MATTKKLQTDLQRLKEAYQRQGITADLKAKIKSQIEKVEVELKKVKTEKKPKPSAAVAASTQVMLGKLQSFVAKNSKKYGSYSGRSEANLKKDAVRHALKIGKRTSQGIKGNQFKSKSEAKGNTYYEYRVNRHDVKQPHAKQTYPILAKGGVMSNKSIKSRYEKNEDENRHSENVVLLAKHFGTPEELKQAKEIKAQHDKDGYLSSENGKKRQDLHLRLIDKARAEMGKEGIEFADGGYMAKGGVSKNNYSSDTDAWFDDLVDLSQDAIAHERLRRLDEITEMEATRGNLEKFRDYLQSVKLDNENIKNNLLTQINNILKGEYKEHFRFHFGGKRQGGGKVSATSEFFSLFHQAYNYGDYMKSGGYMAGGGQINMDRMIWEGWTVGDFIRELEIEFRYHPKFTSKDEVKKWAMSNQPYYKKYIPEVVTYYWQKNQEKYESGGYMEEGGEVLKIKDGDNTWYLTYIDSTHFFLSNSPDFRGNAYHIGQFRGRPFYNQIDEWLKKTKNMRLADGGYMAGGGKLKSLKEKFSNLNYQIQAADTGWIKKHPDEYKKMIEESHRIYEQISKEEMKGYKFSDDWMSNTFAKGGVAEHKLMVGDYIKSIVGQSDLMIINNGQVYAVDIERGTRKLMKEDGGFIDVTLDKGGAGITNIGGTTFSGADTSGIFKMGGTVKYLKHRKDK